MAIPRVLIEMEGGAVVAVTADSEVRVVTIDRDDTPTVGLTVSPADKTLTREEMDRLLSDVLGTVQAALAP